MQSNLSATSAAMPFRIPSASNWLRRGTGIGDVVTFLIPASLIVEFNVVGRLFLPEVMLLVLLPFLLIMRRDILGNRYLLMFVALALLWLLGQIVTDAIRDTRFDDYSRGWASVGFTLTNFVALFLLLHGSRTRLLLFALGAAVGLIIVYLFHPSAYAQSYPWKFGVGYPITILVILIAQYRPIARQRLFSVSLIWGIALVSLYLGSRSLAGETFLAGTYRFMQLLFARNETADRQRIFANAVVMGGIVVAGALVIWVYSYGAADGWFGNTAREEYEYEAITTSTGLLLGGRPEILISSQAIADSPIIGHGSWAKDPRYTLLMFDLAHYGYAVDTFGDRDDLIPTHSCLFGAWVDAGILSVPFWLWIMYLSGTVLLRLYRRFEPLTPLVAFFAFSILWDALFSPFGAERRLFVPFAIILFIFALETDPARALMRRPRAVARG